MLKEPTAARRLRDGGWQLPGDIQDELPVQVYDTRLDPEWVKAVVLEMGLAHKTYIVGGDIMLPSFLGDAAAMNPEQLEWWGASWCGALSPVCGTAPAPG